MSIDPYYVLFTVAKFSAWGELVWTDEADLQWKELDDGYQEKKGEREAAMWNTRTFFD